MRKSLYSCIIKFRVALGGEAMKFRKNENYKTAAVYLFFSVSAVVLLFLLLTHLSVISGVFRVICGVLSPIIYGFIFAYLMNPLMKRYERTLFRFKRHEKLGKRLRRPMSLILTLLSVVIAITLFFIIVLPQIGSSYNELQSQIGYYITAAQDFADSFVRDFPIFNGKYENLSEFVDVNDLSSDVKQIISRIYSILEGVTNYIIEYVGHLVIELKNVIMGIIISIYFLYSKERICAGIKKILRSVLPYKRYIGVIRLTRYTNKTFGGFLTGKLIDSAIIGVLTFLVLTAFSFPYTPLISVVIGVTNIIPFFGPFIGAIPSAFIIFIAEPDKTLWFLLIILIIQQLDGNVIGPKIIGNTTGMSSVAVIVAITVSGGLFGIPGMILGVPAVSVICAVVRHLAERRLRCQGIPADTDYFINSPTDDELSGDSDECWVEEGKPPNPDRSAASARDTGSGPDVDQSANSPAGDDANHSNEHDAASAEREKSLN